MVDIVPIFLPAMVSNKVPSFLPISMRSNPPDVYANFKTNQAWIKNGNSIKTTASLVNVSRAAAATQVDSNGNWTQFTNNSLAYSNLGAAIWESRTNGIRNNTMQGAVAGSPGTLPNLWNGSLGGSGLTQSIVGVGIQNGINYIDLNVSGTSTGSIGSVQYFDAILAAAAAAYGQTWSLSTFVALIAGDFSNVGSLDLTIREDNGTFIQQTLSSILTANSTFRRFTNNVTLTSSLTTGIASGIRIGGAIGSVINFTIRIGWPQLESNTNLLGNVASATIAAGGTGGTAGTAVYSIGGGTLAGGQTIATLNVTVSGGAITAINSVASPGGYVSAGFPPSPAPLTYVSGTGSGVTGATVNLTPTNNAAFAAASPPILTTSVAVNRPGEVDTLVLTGLPAFNAAGTLWCRSTVIQPLPASTTISNSNRYQIELDDGGDTANRILIFASGASGNLQSRYTYQGTSQGLNGLSAYSINTSHKTAIATTSGDQVLYQDGTLQQSAAAVGTPTGINAVHIGAQAGTTIQQLCGNMEEVAIWFTQRVPNAQLANMTT